MPPSETPAPYLDWKKIIGAVILSLIMGGGSAILTSMVWQAKMELRVEMLEQQTEAFEALEASVNELTNSMEKNDVAEKYQAKLDEQERKALCDRVDRLAAQCCE